MFQILPSRNPSTVVFQVVGKATEEDAEKLNEHVEMKFGDDIPFNVMAIVDDIDGTSFKGFIEGFKFDMKRMDQMNKFAVISEKKWTDFATKGVALLPGVEAKNFEEEEMELAWAWIERDAIIK